MLHADINATSRLTGGDVGRGDAGSGQRTGVSFTGEGWDHVYYAPARPRLFGEHGVDPHMILTGSDSLSIPYGGCTAVRPMCGEGTRNVDYATRRLGDHDPHPNCGPGINYWGHKGSLELSLWFSRGSAG